MKVLVVGGGGREHAIITALAKSPQITELHAAPGNGGISDTAVCHNVKATDIEGITKLAKKIKADYVFVAPDDPLVLGMVDVLEANGFKTFGPRKNAAEIEGSKVFSKAFMKRHGIPTASYETFTDAEKAVAYIKERNSFPVVIKCDGLALGKGAIIANDLSEAEKTVSEMLVEKRFGGSGSEIVVEEYLDGVEVTVLVITDGKSVFPLAASTDHKRAFDGDTGLNTGGMGVIAPTPYYTENHEAECLEKIIIPTVKGIAEEGRTFKGCLYVGLMLTDDGVKVIEYNCRFGDPEAQAVLPLLKTDLFEIVKAVCSETLGGIKNEQTERYSACVVMASGGYPEKYETGKLISGLENTGENVTVYHAGTRKSGGDYFTSGGRVLGVTGVGETLEKALSEAYSTVGRISFENAFFRKDIGKKAMNHTSR